jgi:hypothetical protein
MSNEGGRRLIRRLLAEYEVDHIGLSDNERERIAEARALLAAPDAATVRADVAAMLEQGIHESRWLEASDLRDAMSAIVERIRSGQESGAR